jgi:plastocyanin
MHAMTHAPGLLGLLLTVGLHVSTPVADLAGGPRLPARDTVHIEIRGAIFPAEITVPAGTTVIWTNADPLVHTVTAQRGEWGSPALRHGERFAHRFSTPGRHHYLCAPHPHMAGVIIVVEP